MSSISAQGVVERASAELSKRINGLGLRSKSHHHSGSGGGGGGGGTGSGTSSGKTSVMERVTNALCGGGNSNNNSQNNQNNPPTTNSGSAQLLNAPEKPSRLNASSAIAQTNATPTSKQNLSNLLSSKTGTSNLINPNLQMIANSTPQSIRKQQQLNPPSVPVTMEQLFQDDRFLNHFFLYFNSLERCSLAQVCTKWHDVLYRSPRFWSGLLPILQSRELRLSTNQDRVKLYN